MTLGVKFIFMIFLMHTPSDKVSFVQRKLKTEEAFMTKKGMVLAEHLSAQAHYIYIYALHCNFFLPMYIHSFVCFLNFGGSAVSFFNRFAWYLANDPSSRLYCPYSWNRNNVHLCYQQKQYRINIIIMSSQTVSVLQVTGHEWNWKKKKKEQRINEILLVYKGLSKNKLVQTNIIFKKN